VIANIVLPTIGTAEMLSVWPPVLVTVMVWLADAPTPIPPKLIVVGVAEI